MIVADSSALLAIVLKEKAGDACKAVLNASSEVRMSAGTMAEALIVAGRRSVEQQLADLIENLGIVVEPVDAASARRVARAHARWGKGVHPAGLNFGDCFAYALAEELGCPLLYIGEDFARTDVDTASP